MMKKFLVLGCALTCTVLSWGQTEQKIEGYLIEGNISGDYTGKVYLIKEDGMKGEQTIIDSCEVADGKFTFKGPHQDYPLIHFVKSIDAQITPVFLEDGHIRMNINPERFLYADVRGTLNNDIRRFYEMEVKHMMDSLVSATNLFWKKYGRQDDEKENKDFQARSALMGRRNLEIQRDLVQRFPDEAFAPFIIGFEMAADISSEELKALRASLSPKLADHPYTRELDEMIASENFGIGSVAPNFKLQDLNGKILELKNYRGKYVLIDFWASWCGPCRREMPNVAKLYKACKGKDFEIIGISLDDKSDKWHAAVKEMNMSWPQCSELLGWSTSVVRKYNINAVPTTVLVDPEGLVVAINLRGEQLAAKVKELIKKKK